MPHCCFSYKYTIILKVMAVTRILSIIWTKILEILAGNCTVICYSCQTTRVKHFSSFIGPTCMAAECVHESEKKFIFKRSMILTFASLCYAICLFASTIYEFYLSYSNENGFWDIENIYYCGVLILGVNYTFIILISIYKLRLMIKVCNCNQTVLTLSYNLHGKKILQRMREHNIKWTLWCVLSVTCCCFAVYQCWITRNLTHLSLALKIYACSMFTIGAVTLLQCQVDLVEDCYNEIESLLKTHAEITAVEFELVYQTLTKMIFVSFRSLDVLNEYMNPSLTLHVVSQILLGSILLYVDITGAFILGIPYSKLIFYILITVYNVIFGCIPCFLAQNYISLVSITFYIFFILCGQ